MHAHTVIFFLFASSLSNSNQIYEIRGDVFWTTIVGVDAEQ